MLINILLIIISDESSEDPLLPHIDRCNHRTVRHLSSSVDLEDAVEEEECVLNKDDEEELPQHPLEEGMNTPEGPTSKKARGRPSNADRRSCPRVAVVVGGRRIMPSRNSRRVDYVALYVNAIQQNVSCAVMLVDHNADCANVEETKRK